jgi:hypothetical protein
MSGKIIPALAAAVLLGTTVLASAEPKNDTYKYKGANAGQRSERSAKGDRMGDAGNVAANGPYYFFEGGPSWYGRNYYDAAPGAVLPNGGGVAANGPFYFFEGASSSYGRNYYDMAPAAVPPYAPGGYCEYVNTHYDVFVGGDGC